MEEKGEQNPLEIQRKCQMSEVQCSAGAAASATVLCVSGWRTMPEMPFILRLTHHIVTCKNAGSSLAPLNVFMFELLVDLRFLYII